MAVIIQDGIRRMYEDGEDCFYYITMYNEDYAQPAMPEGDGVREGILRGIYKFKAADKGPRKVQLFGSGPILNEVLRAQEILAEKYNIAADVWSVTSYNELRRDCLDAERWNRLHPAEQRAQALPRRRSRRRQGPHHRRQRLHEVPARRPRPLARRAPRLPRHRRLRPLATTASTSAATSRSTPNPSSPQRSPSSPAKAASNPRSQRRPSRNSASTSKPQIPHALNQTVCSSRQRSSWRRGGLFQQNLKFQQIVRPAMAMGSKAFESPLISHARMRAMYRALVETRVLSERAHRSAKLPKGLEACWVATAIDLKPGDLTSTGGATSLIRHTLQIGTREAARAATASEIKKTLRDLVTEKPSAKFPGTPAERLLCAAGQAMALQSLGNKGVVVAYVQQSELKPAALKRVLALCTARVPLLIVATPSPKSPRISLEKAAKPAAIPVIPVDAGDVVALYRVARSPSTAPAPAAAPSSSSASLSASIQSNPCAPSSSKKASAPTPGRQTSMPVFAEWLAAFSAKLPAHNGLH